MGDTIEIILIGIVIVLVIWGLSIIIPYVIDYFRYLKL